VGVPTDADDICYSAVSITVSMGRDAAMVEGGIISGTIHGPGFLIGRDVTWPDRTAANMCIKVNPDTLQSLVRALVAEFDDVVPVYTYSECRSGAARNPDLGMYSGDYLARSEGTSSVRIRCSGVKDDYNRSMWLVVPMGEVDATFWSRLASAMPQNERLQALVAGLRTFWRNNTQPAAQPDPSVRRLAPCSGR
jgi:hypothetical protein